MGTKKIIYFFVIILILCSMSLYSQLSEITLKEKVNKSDLIVIGKVQCIEGRWGERHRAIFTYVTVSIEECIKGLNIEGNITVKIPGYVVEEEGLEVILNDYPTPRFREKEKVLLFLMPIPGEINYSVLFHSAEGKYSIDSGNRIPGTNYSKKKFANKIKAIMASERKEIK